MIGEKIRRQRTALGLSQAQLADGDITRAYISLIETGKRVPSKAVLLRIASKLNKPSEYFLGSGRDEGEGSQFLEESKNLVMENELRKAYTVARKAHQAARRGESRTLEIDTRLHMAVVLFKLKRLDFAMDHLLDTLFEAHELNHRLHVIECYYYLGHVNYRLEHFKVAIRYYLRVISLSKNHKTLQTKYAQSLVYMGSCLVRLERFAAAMSVYGKARTFASLVNLPEILIDAGLGLGWALHENGSPQQALDVTTQALEVSKQNNHYSETELRQNMGICYASLHSLERASYVLNHCLQIYKERGDISGQSTVLEEKVKIALKKGRLSGAKKYIHQALEVLEHQNDSEIKGQLYVHMGTICTREGSTEQAQAYYRLAIEHFRKIRSDRRIAWVTSLLE